MTLRLLTTVFALCGSLISFGQFNVGHTTITFNDPSRTGGYGSGGGSGRQIQTEIYYPAATTGDNAAISSGNFPIIVFGHGFAMAWDAYQNIWEHYVSLGYVMAFPRTEGSLIPSPVHADFGLDLKLVEQRMQAENSLSTSVFYQHLSANSAIMGHSMGGGATLLAAQNNSSIKTIVGLAPAETDPSAIAAAANVTVPAVIYSGSSDGVTPPSDHHIPIYNGLSSDCKTFVSIIGGAHCYFANSNFNCDFGEATSSSGISISRAEQQTRTFASLDSWFDYILKGNNASLGAFLNALDQVPSSQIIPQTTCSVAQINEAFPNDFTIFPNPTDGIVSVDYLKNFPQIIQVFDVYGAIVLENFSDGTIDLSTLKKGFYTLYLNGHFKPILKN